MCERILGPFRIWIEWEEKRFHVLSWGEREKGELSGRGQHLRMYACNVCVVSAKTKHRKCETSTTRKRAAANFDRPSRETGSQGEGRVEVREEGLSLPPPRACESS